MYVALSFCFTRLTFKYWSWWSIHRSAVRDNSNNGLMIPQERQILTPSLYIQDIITSFIFSDDTSSIVAISRDNTTLSNQLCYYNHTYLRSMASTFSIYCIKFLETRVKLSIHQHDNCARLPIKRYAKSMTSCQLILCLPTM